MAAFEQGDLAANLGSVEGALLTMQAAREQRDFVNGSPQAHLINAVEFCLIFNGDLSSALHAIERAEADWERRFHVRVLVLVLHEATSGLGALLGKKFRRIVKQLGVEADLAALHALHSEIVAFTREHYAEHNAIRTNAIAHRDGDSLAQIRSIRALNPDEIAERGWKMVGWLNRTYAFMMTFAASARQQSKDLGGAAT